MEPPLVERIDYGMAVVATTIANSSGGKKGGGQFKVQELHEAYFDFHRSREPKEAIEDVADWVSFKNTLSTAYKKPK